MLFPCVFGTQFAVAILLFILEKTLFSRHDTAFIVLTAEHL